MDFYQLITRLQPKINRLMSILADPAVAPALRKAALTNALQTIGSAVYGKTYSMTAWDFEIAETIGRGMNPQLATGMAKQVSDAVATGDFKLALEQSRNYVFTANGSALYEATQTAGDLGKYRVVTRSLRNETCAWCRARVGTYRNPSDDVFRRHTHCDCLITVQGYRSRNGEVKNYRP